MFILFEIGIRVVISDQTGAIGGEVWVVLEGRVRLAGLSCWEQATSETVQILDVER